MKDLQVSVEAVKDLQVAQEAVKDLQVEQGGLYMTGEAVKELYM